MRLLLGLTLSFWAFASLPSLAAPPPATAFGRLPAIQDAAISPDGSHVAILGGPAGARSLNIAKLD